MTLQQAKDQAAREYGYNDWESAIWEGNHNTLIINRALELYGDAQWNAAIEKAAESGVRECRGYYEHEIYTSILKLKK